MNAILIIFLIFSASKLGPTWLSSQTTRSHQQTVRLFLSVIWEGEKIDQNNITKLNAFRDRHPNYHFHHFISPAYFSRPNENHHLIADDLKRMIRSGDRVGMSIQTWKSLVQSSNIIFRSGPSFWGRSLEPEDCEWDCGKDIALTDYDPNEIRSLLNHGLKILSDAGFRSIDSLFVAGWMADRHVLQAASQLGIAFDFSGIAPSRVKSSLGEFPLYDKIEKLWPETFEAGELITFENQSSIFEIGNNAATVDHVTPEEVESQFRDLIRSKNQKKILHLGIHHETADIHLARLEESLQRMEFLSQSLNINLESTVMGGQKAIAVLH